MELTRELIEEKGGEMMSYDAMINKVIEGEIRFVQEFNEKMIDDIGEYAQRKCNLKKFDKCSTLFAAIYNISQESYNTIKWDREPMFSTVKLAINIEDFDDPYERTVMCLKGALNIIEKKLKKLDTKKKSTIQIAKIQTAHHLASSIIIGIATSSGSIELIEEAIKDFNYIKLNDE